MDYHEKRLEVNESETTQNEDHNNNQNDNKNESTTNEAETSSTDSGSEINTDESSSSGFLTNNTSCNTLSSLASTNFSRADSRTSLESVGLDRIVINLACGHSVDITAPLQLDKCPECDKKVSKKAQKRILALQKANAIHD